MATIKVTDVKPGQSFSTGIRIVGVDKKSDRVVIYYVSSGGVYKAEMGNNALVEVV